MPTKQQTPPAETALIIGASLVALGAVHAVEGVVWIIRDILGVGAAGAEPSGATGSKAESRAKPKGVPHQTAAVFLIVGAAYTGAFLHRAFVDVRAAVREVVGLEPAHRTRRAIAATSTHG